MDYTPLGFENPMDFLLELSDMRNMLKHVGRINDVKRAIVVRNDPSIVLLDWPNAMFAVSAVGQVDRLDIVTAFTQGFALPARAATNLQDASAWREKINDQRKLMRSNGFKMLEGPFRNPKRADRVDFLQQFLERTIHHFPPIMQQVIDNSSRFNQCRHATSGRNFKPAFHLIATIKRSGIRT